MILFVHVCDKVTICTYIFYFFAKVKNQQVICVSFISLGITDEQHIE